MGYGIVKGEQTLQMGECDIGKNSLYNATNNKNSILTLIESIGIRDERTQMVDSGDNFIITTEPFYEYLVPAIGITIGRLLGLNANIVYYLRRLANFVIYILLVCWAIKKIPFCKPLMFVIALLPMSIHQAISYSYDVPTNALAFLFIAYSLEVIYNGLDNTTKKDKIIAALLAILMTGCKRGAYMPICLIFIPSFFKKKNFKNKKYIVTTIIMVVFMFIFVNIGSLKNIASVSTEIDGRMITLYSKKWVLENPLKYIIILFRTLYILGETYLKTMIGQLLGPLDTPLNV